MQQHHDTKSLDDNRYFDAATTMQNNDMDESNQYHNHHHQQHHHHHHRQYQQQFNKDIIDESAATVESAGSISSVDGGGTNMNELQDSQPHRKHRITFDKTTSGNVTTLLGRTAYLNCRVKSTSMGLRLVSTANRTYIYW